MEIEKTCSKIEEILQEISSDFKVEKAPLKNYFFIYEDDKYVATVINHQKKIKINQEEEKPLINYLIDELKEQLKEPWKLVEDYPKYKLQ
jgi:hypothetical protein